LTPPGREWVGMPKRFLLICAAALLSLPGRAAWAEEGARPSPSVKASPSASPYLSKFQQRIVNVLKLDLDAARALSHRPASRDRLIILYEKLVEMRCMPQLSSTLEYAGNPQDAECLEYLEQLRTLYPEDLVAACASNGIDSESCRTAYEDQFIGTYKKDQPGVEEVDLEVKLGTLKQENSIKKLVYALEQASFKFRKSNLPEDRKELREAYTKLLPVACRLIRIKLQHTPPPETFRAAVILAPPEINKDDPLNQLVKQYGEAKSGSSSSSKSIEEVPAMDEDAPFQRRKAATPRPTPAAPVWRVRYLTEDCSYYIRQALAFEPNFMLAVCFQQGFSSPDCVNARRRERERLRKEAETAAPQGTSSPEKTSGLGEF
jgi:hypothetical protein